MAKIACAAVILVAIGTNQPIPAISPAPIDDASTGTYRNGSELNVTAKSNAESGWDSRVDGGRFDVSLRANLPITMSPGDSLTTAISIQTLSVTPSWLLVNS